MKLAGNQIRVSATDLSNHLACRHLTSLDLKVARGERKAPDWAAPDLVVIQQLGLRHEAEYLEFMWVIPTGNDFAGEAYRFAEYAAYYRYVKQKFLDAVAKRQEAETYPEPVEHCQVCRWFKECDKQRRADDHLSLVAGIMRQQRSQLEDWDVETMAKLAKMPIPLKERPERGSRDGYARVREQGRVQVAGRTQGELLHEAILPVVEGTGLALLPEPTNEDIFLEFEGDRFVGEAGVEYLTGIAFQN